MITLLISWLLFRAFVIFIGFLCLALGYKLLTKGIFDGGADLTAAWDNNKKLILKRASPGVVFAIIGCVVIVFNTIYSEFKQDSRITKTAFNPTLDIDSQPVSNASSPVEKMEYSLVEQVVNECSKYVNFKDTLDLLSREVDVYQRKRMLQYYFSLCIRRSPEYLSQNEIVENSISAHSNQVVSDTKSKHAGKREKH